MTPVDLPVVKRHAERIFRHLVETQDSPADAILTLIVALVAITRACERDEDPDFDIPVERLAYAANAIHRALRLQ